MINSLSFVFPVYNEIETIEKTIALAYRVGHKITKDFEIIVVDDASTDGSGELADQLTRRYPELRVIHHAANRKLGTTLRTSFSAAKKEWILYIDSDLPLDFKEIRKVVPLTKHTDLIAGYRLSRHESLQRTIMTKVYNSIVKTIFGLNVRDVNFSFKLFRRSLLRKIALRSEGLFINAELLIQAKKLGYFPIEVGFKYYPRLARKSSRENWQIILGVLKEMAYYLFAINPTPPRPIEIIEFPSPKREKITSIA